jgi:hypothetical protein
LQERCGFFVCWKQTQGGPPLKIGGGLRKFVDKGSPIASDTMFDCPQVQLDEILAVTLAEKYRALGGNGLAHNDEIKAGQNRDCTVFPQFGVMFLKLSVVRSQSLFQFRRRAGRSAKERAHFKGLYSSVLFVTVLRVSACPRPPSATKPPKALHPT